VVKAARVRRAAGREREREREREPLIAYRTTGKVIR
jgi:hypothetical protein